MTRSSDDLALLSVFLMAIPIVFGLMSFKYLAFAVSLQGILW